MAALYITSAAIAIFDLCYQNSGWEQFGYRFALDYMVVLITLLALGGRHFGKGFLVLLFFSIGVNTFGAITFGRNGEFYDNNPSIFFQPD